VLDSGIPAGMTEVGKFFLGNLLKLEQGELVAIFTDSRAAA